LSIVGAVTGLSDSERRRYARHLVLAGVGEAGQERLKAARVLCVGAGGLGSPVLIYLAAAGVGSLGLVEFDVVEESNLHRQVLYGTKDLGRPKLDAAVERLSDLNPNVSVVTHATALTSLDAARIFPSYDIVVGATDNFPSRYVVNEACVRLDKPMVHAAIHRFEGQAAVFWAAKGPCFRCAFPDPPPPGLVPTGAESGLLGVLPGTLGAIQATEVLKLILGIGEPLVGRLLVVDALAMSFRMVRLPKDPACAGCGGSAARA
jgi:molybdopterin/thiamine biosynthesis adenylyltransferase